jgi:hypothetical protein
MDESPMSSHQPILAVSRLLPARRVDLLVDYPGHRSLLRLLRAVVLGHEAAIAVALAMGDAIGW